MTMQRKIFASIGIALLFATGSFAQQVKTDYDRSANFSHTKTIPGKGADTRPLWVDRIKRRSMRPSGEGWTR